jgi:methyltransferase family protein
LFGHSFSPDARRFSPRAFIITHYTGQGCRELSENWATIGIDVENVILAFYVRDARRKALAAARMEALCLLRDLNPIAPDGGPGGERGSVFWIAFLPGTLDRAVARLPRLGYTRAVDLPEDLAHAPVRRNSRAERVRWRHREYQLTRLYEEDAEALRERAPDRRIFVLENAGGAARPVPGYRGDSGPLSRRGLPVPDARLLVNLVTAVEGATFLDPFAGVGGVVIEAVESGYRVLSCDCDPALRRGLSALGLRHSIADARTLPLATEAIDAIATEPPYDAQAEAAVLESLAEMHRVLKRGGRLALMCAARQADGLRQRASALGLRVFLDSHINRKGTDCTVLAWEKAGCPLL